MNISNPNDVNGGFEMLSTKIIMLTRLSVLLLLLLLLPGCSDQSKTPVIADEKAETVNLVLYYSDGDIDWKSYGETILIDSGERLKVRRNQIRPSAELITNKWTDVFVPELEKSSHIGKLPLKLDRKNGIVCNTTHCTTLYSICPSWSEMRQGKKCVSFSRD